MGALHPLLHETLQPLDRGALVSTPQPRMIDVPHPPLMAIGVWAAAGRPLAIGAVAAVIWAVDGAGLWAAAAAVLGLGLTSGAALAIQRSPLARSRLALEASAAGLRCGERSWSWEQVGAPRVDVVDTVLLQNNAPVSAVVFDSTRGVEVFRFASADEAQRVLDAVTAARPD